MPLCKVLLMNVANFPWIILVPKVSDKSEIFELNQSDLEKYHTETNYLLEAMSELYKADKMNIASLGNLVPQLHTHIIVCLLYTSPSPRDGLLSRMPSSA